MLVSRGRRREAEEGSNASASIVSRCRRGYSASEKDHTCAEAGHLEEAHSEISRKRTRRVDHRHGRRSGACRNDVATDAVAAAKADIRADNQAAAIQPAPEAAPKQSWNVATRWPEPAAAASASDQPAAATPTPQPAPVLTAERFATAAAPAPAAPPAAVTTAATQAPPQQTTQPADTEGLSLRILLSILVCVLALAAIVGPLLFKYFRPKPRVDERTHGQRRQIWDLDESDQTFLQDNPPPALAPHYPHTLPKPRMLDDATDEIEELLARVSKRSVA